MVDKQLIAIFFMSVLVISIGIISYEYTIGKPGDNSYDYEEVVQQEDLIEDEELVYMSFVSGTEYSSGDTDGQTIITFRDFRNNFINTSCWETILYPNRSIYISETPMNQNVDFGTYYLDFGVGETIGNYQQDVKCLVNNRNVSNGKAYHVANLSRAIKTKILQAEVNIKDRVDTVLDALNCSLTPNVTMCEKLNNLENVSNQLLIQTNVSETLNFTQNVLIQINDSFTEVLTLFYEIDAPACFTFNDWDFRAKVTDEKSHILPFLDCTLETNVFGSETINYNSSLERYRVVHPCSPSGVTSWNFSCVRDY